MLSVRATSLLSYDPTQWFFRCLCLQVAAASLLASKLRADTMSSWEILVWRILYYASSHNEEGLRLFGVRVSSRFGLASMGAWSIRYSFTS